MKELLEKKQMSSKTEKKYTVGDVYKEAAQMLKDEMRQLKQQTLTPSEEIKMQQLAKLLSNMVLKEMKVV